MEIERLLKISKHASTEKEAVEMILANRIDYYLGDDIGAAISARKFSVLADDLLKWREANHS